MAGRGPEERLIIGNLTEKEVKIFFENFTKWKLEVCNDDLSEYIDGKGKSGYDQIYSYVDPLDNRKKFILVESKFRTDENSISKSALKEMIYTLKDKVEKLKNPRSWKKTIKSEIKGISMGILFIRFNNFTNKKLAELIGSISISDTTRTKIPTLILILSNNKICKFLDLRDEFDKIDYIYPIDFTDQTTNNKSVILNPELLFSDIILGEGTKNKKKFKFLCSFESPNKENVKYLLPIAMKFLNIMPKEKCNIYFTEGNVNSISKYEQDFLDDKHKKNVKLKILNSTKIDCNFNFEKFK